MAMTRTQVPGYGEVLSFTTLHSPPTGFASPLHMALVEMEGGTRFFCHGTGTRGLKVGSRVSIEAGLVAGDDRAATTAFRVVQEALTNAARHAEAQHADVTVTARDGALELCVADDGIGIDAARTRARRDETSGGVGLIGMRERVQALGGTLSIRDRAPQRGTEVRCSLPLLPRDGVQDHRAGEPS